MAKEQKQSKKSQKAKPETVHVGLLIDETGSMAGMEPAVVGGVNEFVESLRKQEEESRVLATLAKFDLHGSDPVLRVQYAGIPLDEVALLEPGDYAPRGATPLNDAVVGVIRTIDKAVSDGERAILVVLTDGYENASETSTKKVRKKIRAKEADGWEFIYLGADQDSWAEAEQIGIADAPGKAFDYDKSEKGTADALKLSADRVQSFRKDAVKYREEADEIGRSRRRKA